MDININVRLQKFRESATSASGSVKRKNKSLNTIKTESIPAETGLAKIANGNIGLMSAGALTLMATSKMLHTANRLEGSITGDRFQERRRSDMLKTATNPAGMLRSIITTQITKHYDTTRELERTEYRRQLSGLVMPFRDTDPGLRL